MTTPTQSFFNVEEVRHSSHTIQSGELEDTLQRGQLNNPGLLLPGLLFKLCFYAIFDRLEGEHNRFLYTELLLDFSQTLWRYNTKLAECPLNLSSHCPGVLNLNFKTAY